MFRRRANGALRRSDSQQAVKSPPLLVSGTAAAVGKMKANTGLAGYWSRRGATSRAVLPCSCSPGKRKGSWARPQEPEPLGREGIRAGQPLTSSWQG